MYNLLESIRYIGILLLPFLPETGHKILDQLDVKEELRTLDSIAAFGALEPMRSTGEAAVLFARLDEAKTLKRIEEDNAAKAAEHAEKKEEPKAQPEPELISIDEFDKVALKVGKVLECQRVKGADKLLVSQIQIGKEVRQIVSGIAKYYAPEEFVGKQVVVVTNLKPVKLRGVLSQGMILCATDEKGGYCVIRPESDVAPGAEVR